tara:strand:- start:4889 stop:5785 length:897 start_codon:yes stop_codon:yes gene_type:complete
MKKKFDLMSKNDKVSSLYKASTLVEALPYIRQHNKKIVVIKYGGHAMGDKKLSRNFAEDIGLLKEVGIMPIIIHGGGPQIDNALKKSKIQTKFIEGLRVSNKEVIRVVENILVNKLNKKIKNEITNSGTKVVGLAGNKKKIILAKKLKVFKSKKNIDIGFVGYPVKINVKLINKYLKNNLVPIIAPLGTDGRNTFNINADTVAGAVAGAIKSNKLIMMTNVSGIKNKKNKLITGLTLKEAKKLIDKEFIRDGMKPKIKTCISALQKGVKEATILDGRVPHAIILELFTIIGVGTQIRK